MPRMPKKRKLELSFFLNERGRVTYNDLYLILESGEPLVAAMALYRKIGYKVIPNYGQYKDMPDSICMRKEL